MIQLADSLTPRQRQRPDGQLIRHSGLQEFGPIETLWKAETREVERAVLISRLLLHQHPTRRGQHRIGDTGQQW